MEDDMLRLTPFLLFNGNCAEAMTFYQACFGGELRLTRLADTPMKAGFPAEQHDKVTYAHLRSSAIEISATDWLHPTRKPEQGNMTAMCVSSAEPDELRSIFAKLSASADKESFVDLREMPFGLYGRFTDRYGKEWFFRGEKPNA
jgi:PhnB protein